MPREYSLPSQPSQQDYPYFRRVWNNVVTALLAVSFLPLILIGGGMYLYAERALNNKTIESLRLEVLNHKKAIDSFLAERTSDLKLVSTNLDRASLTRQETLEAVYKSLQRELPCFIDLGIIDDQGRHLAYTGPYELITKNYKEAAWFKQVMARDVYVSDIFLGFRKVPHFVIAVRQSSPEGDWIIRATVDSAYFDAIVSEISPEMNADAFLVDRKGIFQTRPRRGGQLMGQSEVKGLEPFQGIRIEELGGWLRVMVWLDKAPWLCVVQVEQKKVFAELHRIRNAGIFVFILGGILIVLTVLLTTNHLISRLERKRRSIRFLDHQLRRTSRLAASAHLSAGVFSEVQEALANIEVAGDWIGELAGRDPAGPETAAEIRKSVEQIKAEALASRRAIDKFLSWLRPAGPVIMEVDVHHLLDELIELLERELRFSNIEVVRDYQADLPQVRSDPGQLSQVFQNLILNAISALKKGGALTLKTIALPDRVRVIVSDSGPGIPEENLVKIFDPFFTTSPDGIGLGLTISLNILEKLGGAISAESRPGQGASFIIEIPLRLQAAGNKA